MKKEVCLLTRKDAPQMTKLLEQANSKARGFIATKEASAWGIADDFYFVLGIKHDNTLVSVTRVEWILTLKELNYKINGISVGDSISFPAVYLTKAGTLPEVRAQGLNSVLRYFAIQLANHWKAQFVLGTMVEGSPRVFSMREMGYQFQTLPKKWEGLYQSEAFPMAAILDLQKNGHQALDYLEKMTFDYRKDLVCSFDLEKLKINNDLKVQWPWSA